MREQLNLLRYELKNTWLSMKRHWVLCLSSVTTIFLCLSLVAVFLLIGTHVSAFSSGLARDLAIHVVLDESIEENDEIQEIRAELEGMDNVASVQFSSKDAELELMIAEKGQAFSSYRGDENPLSNAFFVYLIDQEAIEQTREDILALDEVADAQYGGASVTELAEMLRFIQQASVLFIVLLSLLSLYLIYSTIKTSIDSRETEIAIQKSVGATVSFIRRPFEFEGIALGFIGALIPFAILCIFYPILYQSLGGRLFISAFALQDPGTMLLWSGIVLFGIGILMGFFASTIAVGRKLKNTR